MLTSLDVSLVAQPAPCDGTESLGHSAYSKFAYMHLLQLLQLLIRTVPMYQDMLALLAVSLVAESGPYNIARRHETLLHTLSLLTGMPKGDHATSDDIVSIIEY